MARTSSYNEEKAERICLLLQAGNPRKYAYGSVGIDAKTFAKWMKDFPEFKEKVEDAQAKAPVSLHNVVIKGCHPHEVEHEVLAYKTYYEDGKPVEKVPVAFKLRRTEFDPRLALSLLERLYPEHYKARQDLTSGDKPLEGAQLVLNADVLTQAQRELTAWQQQMMTSATTQSSTPSAPPTQDTSPTPTA